jgi:cytochrome c oxidase assembly protein subunit 11
MSVAIPSGRGRLLLLLMALPIVMGLLAFLVMPRLYSLWCTVTGTGMRPNNPSAAVVNMPTGRFVEVFFETKIFDGLPVEFTCDKPASQVEVGREATNIYRLRNTGDQVLHIRPIHQVSPISATPHFGMRICFCFNDQVVKPGEVLEYPVAFSFDSGLDPRIGSVSVCYSLFTIDPSAPRSAEQERVQRQIQSAGGIVSPGFSVLNEAELHKLRAQEQRAANKATP